MRIQYEWFLMNNNYSSDSIVNTKIDAMLFDHCNAYSRNYSAIRLSSMEKGRILQYLVSVDSSSILKNNFPFAYFLLKNKTKQNKSK